MASRTPADQIRPLQHPSDTTSQSMADRPEQEFAQSGSILSQTQQDLLLAAFNSQAVPTSSMANGRTARSNTLPVGTMNGANLFMSPQQAELDNFNADYTPELDYLDNDGFDFDNADLGGDMIGALPGEQHEKRKMSEDYDDEEEGDAKRQETQGGEKGSKKPGRKPLTSEPTTKRKAQNRAAQRAFRERKEKHLKDLETKVTELTKKQEAEANEKTKLKAEVERLQVELREYRKRLSLNGGSGANRSPPLTAYGQSMSSTNAGNGGFQFDFPKFGALPGSQMFGNQSYGGANTVMGQHGSITPPMTHSPTERSLSGAPTNAQSRSNSMGRSMSPNSAGGSNHQSPAAPVGTMNPAFTTYSTNNNMHGFASTLPQMNSTGNDAFADLFSPSILKSSSIDSTNSYFQDSPTANGLSKKSDPNGGDTTAGLNRVFQFNSAGSSCDSASPSASSASQWNANANSSCGTSPEPAHGQSDMPNINNFQQINTSSYNVPSVDSFDPVLFGDYRDAQPFLNDADLNSGFFDDTLNSAPFDMASPSNLFGILQSPEQTHDSLGMPSNSIANAPTPSRHLMAEIEKARDGDEDEYGLPNTVPLKKEDKNGKLISCNNIWNQLQSNPDFQEGKFDLDGLCSELRAKARCSESGVMVDQDHVDAALRKLGKKDEKTGEKYEGPKGLMFEQESWENVLKRMGGGSV